MTKTEFFEKLRKELSGLPKSEIDELIAFYGEMIDDRMEEGLTEEDAVTAAGSIEQIVSQAINDTMLAKIAKERIKPKRKLTALELVLLAIGSPIWISLAVSVIAVIFALYISLWSIIVAAYAVFAAIIATIVGSFASGIILLCKAFVLQGFANILVDV